MTPEAFLKAYDAISLQNDAGAEGKAPNEPYNWFVIDVTTAEYEVNWPGDLISEHKDRDSARIAWAQAIITKAEKESQ